MKGSKRRKVASMSRKPQIVSVDEYDSDDLIRNIDVDSDAADDGEKDAEDAEIVDDESRDEKEADVDSEAEDDEDQIDGAEFISKLEVTKPPSEKNPKQVKTVSFKDIGVASWLVKELDAYGLGHPTPVQANCIPKILDGSDVLGCAKTGTGKTLAFALPIMQKLAVDPYGIFAVILTPTRELATQIADQFVSIGRSINLKVCTIIGGMDQCQQSLELSRKPHIVVATPGRLADHISSDSRTAQLFRSIQILVLDEADQMLDGPYAAPLATIFGSFPKKRQTLLFSATLTSALTQLHQVSVHKPFFFEDTDPIRTVERLEQRYVLCPISVKDAYLVYVVKSFYENNPERSILIFCQTCRECEALSMMFRELGFNVASLHSMISQRERNQSLSDFRSKKRRVLICTDVAARGLDVPHVDLVVNHNVPRSPKTYVHRVGRSARAGRFGSAITFITQYDIALVQAVEELVGKKMEKLSVSHKKVTKYVTDVLMLKREAEIKLERQKFGEKREINRRKDMIMNEIPEEEVKEANAASKARKRKKGGRNGN